LTSLLRQSEKAARWNCGSREEETLVMNLGMIATSCLILMVNDDVYGSTELNMLKTIPSITASTYACGKMILTVNHFRRLGKDKSIAILRDYITNGGDNCRVHIICRLLFDNPTGWAPPLLGEPSPNIKNAVAKRFPMFPIAIWNGVPFLLVHGYNLEGMEESALDCLRVCQELSLVKQDYPATGFEQAAQEFVQSRSFRDLYSEKDQMQMTRLILNQARR
jgi:hypothetical protein